jgi:ferredoxin-thioredoxin reductase catalytic subunit
MNKEELREISQKYAESQGYWLNNDEERLNALLEALLRNEEKHGFRYCPCRALTGNKEEDAKNICPCVYHKDEIKQDGYCKCTLFFGNKEG